MIELKNMTGLKKIAVQSLIVLAVAVLLAPASQAQSGRKPPANNQQSQDEPIRLRAEEVLLNITVIDPYGRQATDLRKDEFIIAEDDKRQDISSFVISSVPVNVILMLDASGSIVSEISSLREAAMGFVSQLRPEDKVAIMEFHTKIELLQDWTSNAEDLRHAISWRFKPGMVRTKEGHSQYGMTSLYDALYLSAQEQLSKIEGRKAIILLTDGDDSSSKVTYDQALTSIIRSGAVVYVVSKAREFINAVKPRNALGRVFSDPRLKEYLARLERAEQIMTDLSKRTGGQIFSPLKSEEMKDVYAQVARELKNQYIITYVPKNETRDGRLRHVKVFLTRNAYQARTRESYYAPKN